MHKILISVLLTACVAAARTLDQPQADASRKLDCSPNMDFECILTKIVVVVRSMQQSDDIEILEGINLVRDTPVESSARDLQESTSEEEILKELPQSAAERTMKLIKMLFYSSVSFIKSHNLKLNIGEEEARTKIKKIWPILLLIGIKIFTLGPIMIGGLILTAMKSFFVSKISLLISVVLAFLKFFNNDSANANKINPINLGWYDGAANWYPAANYPTTNQGSYQRSTQVNANANVDAHNLAYTAYIPLPNSNTN